MKYPAAGLLQEKHNILSEVDTLHVQARCVRREVDTLHVQARCVRREVDTLHVQARCVRRGAFSFN